MRHRARNSGGLAGLALIGLLLLTGCSPAAPDGGATRTVTATVPDGSASSGAASASPTAPPPSSTRVAPAGSPSPAKTDPDAPSGQCADGALAVSVQHDPEGDGAGQRGAFVVLRNAGTSPCRLEGTPGLSLVGRSNGTQIGAPAARTTQHTRLVTLEPGRYALAPVTYTYVDGKGGNFNDGHGGDVRCDAKPADGYRVYPPHSYRAFFSASKTYACSTAVHWISVGPVRAAGDFPYFTPKP